MRRFHSIHVRVVAAAMVLLPLPLVRAADRTLDVDIPRGVPLKVLAVREVQGREFHHCLEVEMENTGDEPIYAVCFTIRFPNYRVADVERGFLVPVGDVELCDARRRATEQEPVATPGASFTVRVTDEGFLGGFDHTLQLEETPADAYDRVVLAFQSLSFRDGTGMILGKRVAAP